MLTGSLTPRGALRPTAAPGPHGLCPALPAAPATPLRARRHTDSPRSGPAVTLIQRPAPGLNRGTAAWAGARPSQKR